MAKKVEEKLIKAKALVNIKYDKDCFKIGEEFDVRKEESEEMEEKGYVELLEEVKTEKPAENEGEPPKEGE